jgi:hypothetical protein
VSKGGRVHELRNCRRHEDRAERDLDAHRQPGMCQPLRAAAPQGFAPFATGRPRFCQSGNPSL